MTAIATSEKKIVPLPLISGIHSRCEITIDEYYKRTTNSSSRLELLNLARRK